MHLFFAFGTNATQNNWKMKQRKPIWSVNLHATRMIMAQHKLNQMHTNPSPNFKSKPHATTNRRSTIMDVVSEGARFATCALKHAKFIYESQILNIHTCIKSACNTSNSNKALASARWLISFSQQQMTIAKPRRKPPRVVSLKKERCLKQHGQTTILDHQTKAMMSCGHRCFVALSSLDA